MRHTPGPWIRSKHGFNVLTNDSMRSIAAVHAIHPGHSSDKDSEEQIANAALIAAAPELLAMVKDLASVCLLLRSNPAKAYGVMDLLVEAEKLIAKAQGH